MRARSAPSAPLFSEGGQGTLRLLAYLFLALMIMVADHRGGHLDKLRGWAGLLNEPLFRLAELPAWAVRQLRDGFVQHHALVAERDALQSALLVAGARLARLDAVQAENQRLRGLLGGTRNLSLEVRLASLADVDLDPFRHRVWLDLGAAHGIETGMAVIDAGGVFGQVVETSPQRALVMLVSDPAHAIPVQVQRTGIRTIAYGTGELDRLNVPNIPQSADVRAGDQLVTSGLGGRFPAGLPVAEIVAMRSDDTRLFLVAEARPSALLERSREVLLVWQAASSEPVGPPADLGPSGGSAPEPSTPGGRVE